MARRVIVTAAVALAAGPLAAGCGGSPRPPGAAQVRATVRAAFADLAHADGHAFCALATPAVRARMDRLIHGEDCAAFVHVLGRHLSRGHRLGLLHAVVGHVTVHGSTAAVASADITTTRGSLKGWLSDGGTPTRLRRGSDGRWLIAG